MKLWWKILHLFLFSLFSSFNRKCLKLIKIDILVLAFKLNLWYFWHTAFQLHSLEGLFFQGLSKTSKWNKRIMLALAPWSNWHFMACLYIHMVKFPRGYIHFWCPISGCCLFITTTFCNAISLSRVTGSHANYSLPIQTRNIPWW